MFEVQDEKIRDLDKRVADYNEEFNVLYENLSTLPNPFAYQELRAKNLELLSELKNTSPDTEFDNLVKEHIESQLMAQLLFLDFFFNEKKNLTTMLDACLGPNIFEKMEKRARNYDYKRMWNASKLEAKRLEYKIDGLDYIKEGIKKYLPIMRERIFKYCVEQGYLPNDFDFELELSDETSSWGGGCLLLDVSSFRSFRYKNKTIVNPSEAYLNFIHELGGHASQEEYSKNMPLTLRSNDANFSNFVSMPTVEGIADKREIEFINYLKIHQNELGFVINNEDENITICKIPDDELRYSLANFNYMESYVVLEDFYKLLRLKELEGNFDAKKYFSEFSRKTNPGLYNLLEQFIPKDVEDHKTIYNISYYVGLENIEAILKNIETNYGKEYCEKNKKIINEALSTGCWSWKTYPKFVDFYLRNMKR